MNSETESEAESPSQPRLQALQTGLLIAGSALLGGLAVVLWNRSSLSRLRQAAETASEPPASGDEEDV